MKNPKISIIVPVYKVEKYLHKCIDSILAQTLIDFELILINDGSPDRCGEICEEYEKSDPRVRVIHKKNGGISSARNAGLDIATGDYIGFVDSDDWIEPDMYEILYNECVKNECEIISCSSIIHYHNKTVVNGGHPLIIHNVKEAMEIMLKGALYDEVVWTKLFKRSVLKELRFSVGIIYEDTDFTYKAIHRSKRTACIGVPKYHYIKRENSTMDLAVKNVNIDRVFIYDEMYKFMNKHYQELRELVALKLANSAMSVLNIISLHPNYLNYKQDYYKVVEVLNHYYSIVIKLKEYPLTVKSLLTVAKIHPLFYMKLIKWQEAKRNR